MKDSIRTRLEQLAARLQELDRALAAEDAAADVGSFRKLGQERAELEEVVGLYAEYVRVEADCRDAEQLLADAEMRELAELELSAGSERLAELEQQLQLALLPRDPADERDLFIEIRAGTGGDEAALFAGDLLRMYTRYAEGRRWKVELISAHESDLGGFKEVIARISGRGAYSQLKFESGGHRVQRVPVTETQGRIHTSACTVAVLAEADELMAVAINPAELRIDTFRASGAGGQHVNKTDSAVRITHLPSGMVVECQDDRSQHRNKAQAMAVLAARLHDQQLRAQQTAAAQQRRQLIGSGDRSERIRTYNFPQGRVTDHRINLTLYKLEAVMAGELDELIAALTLEHQTALLAALGHD